MSRIVDNIMAYKMLNMLVTPFEESDAYKLGIIDKDGHNLIKSSKLTSSDQKDAYSYLNRLVFNVKKILNKLPGSESKLRNLIAAFWLVKEAYEQKESVDYLSETMVKILQRDIALIEEEIEVKKFLKKKQSELEEDGVVGGAPTNSTGAAVSTDIPVPKKKDVNKYKAGQGGLMSFGRRNNKVM